MRLLLRVTCLLAGVVVCAPSPETLKSDISVLVQNDLKGPENSQDFYQVLTLHGQLTLNDAKTACESLGESLLPWSSCPSSNSQTLLKALRYHNSQASIFWVEPTGDTSWALDLRGEKIKTAEGTLLPVLCTQSAPGSNDTVNDPRERWRVTVRANNDDILGYRDRNSFRFLGVRYAQKPALLSYPVPYRGVGQRQSALELGQRCTQGGPARSGISGSEDCLFLNIWTPYLPGPTNTSLTKDQKAVMFWIHGSALLGHGGDPDFDGGNLASRGDVVVVTINYRVGAPGFLALDDGVTNGNFGFADQILALDWVREHIGAFGGDPDRITVFGDSAGAAFTRAMMRSPKAVGKFAAAMPISHIGGLGVAAFLGKYWAIKEYIDLVGKVALDALNCTETTSQSQLACLRQHSAGDLWWAGLDSRMLVIDGEYITSDKSQHTQGTTSPVHIMTGIMAEDGLPLLALPSNVTLGDTTWLVAQGLPDPPPDLFPLPDITNRTLATYQMAARFATDAMFRCSNQAAVHGALQDPALGWGEEIFYYEFERTYQKPDWPQLDLCEAPRSPAHPNGDPDSPEGNLRCHSGSLLYAFGNIVRRGLPHRDDNDSAFERYVVDIFSSFARTFNPNPDRDFLLARGYNSTLSILEQAGPWVPAVKDSMKARILDLPGEGNMMRDFKDKEQCAWMGLL